MPAKRKNEVIPCEYFTWILSRRGGVYRADGRSHNSPPQSRRPEP